MASPSAALDRMPASRLLSSRYAGARDDLRSRRGFPASRVAAGLAVATLAGAVLLRLVLNALLPLADTTEARYGEIVRVGLENGFWLMPHAAPGVPFFAKPPASTWASMLAGTLLGPDEAALRLPSTLLAHAGAAMVAWLVRGPGRGAPGGALLAAAVLLTAPLGFVIAGAVMTDAVHVFAVTVAMTCATALLVSPEADRGRWRLVMWAAIGAGTLAKGLATVALALLPIVLYGLVVRTPLRTARTFVSLPALGLALLVALPWYLAAEARFPGFLRYFLVGEHLQRFLEPGWTGDRYGNAHRAPIGMIWAYAAASAGPWLLAALVPARRGPAADPTVLGTGSPGAAWWACWMLAPLLLFTFARNIIWTYAATALPPFAVWLGLRLGRATPGRRAAVAALALAWVGVLAVAAPRLVDRVGRNSARALLAQADRLDPQRRLPRVVPGALKFSGALYSDGRACTSNADAAAQCDVGGEAYVIVRPDDAARAVQAGAGRIVAESGRHVLVHRGAPR